MFEFEWTAGLEDIVTYVFHAKGLHEESQVSIIILTQSQIDGVSNLVLDRGLGLLLRGIGLLGRHGGGLIIRTRL